VEYNAALIPQSNLIKIFNQVLVLMTELYLPGWKVSRCLRIPVRRRMSLIHFDSAAALLVSSFSLSLSRQSCGARYPYLDKSNQTLDRVRGLTLAITLDRVGFVGFRLARLNGFRNGSEF